MSNMYAIKEETLTALGDVVRSKLGFNEVKKTQAPTSIDYNDMIKIDLPVWASKAKVVGHCYSTTNTISSVFQGLGYAIGTNYLMGNGVRLSADYTLIINDSNNYLDENFEIIINSNSFTFVPSFNAPANPITVSFEITCLDENGNEFKYTPTEMVDKINELDTVPTEALTIAGDCSYRFAYGGNDWLINQCGDKITTKDITSAKYAFNYSKVNYIPFDFNFSTVNNYDYSYMFSGCNNLEGFGGTFNNMYPSNINNMFESCSKLKTIPQFKNFNPNKLLSYGYSSAATIFSGCYSLREIDFDTLKLFVNPQSTSSYYSFYCNLVRNCASLDYLKLPVVLANYTSNVFTYAVESCERIKDLIFETNEDGSVITANWKSQTIDLSTSRVGYSSITNKSRILDYNSGITADKEVKDDATYQALKNDPDWFSCDVNYSRYNHDSAVNTINSLPDTSAYGTNVIKFKGAAGALTDGGAINTLTEEEIAVAAAKGWTVTLS